MWKSSDFYYCVCILASGRSVTSVERIDSKRVMFGFDCTKEVGEQIVSNHWEGTLCISTKKVVEAINQLKTMIYQAV